jgi:hypothetical protein
MRLFFCLHAIGYLHAIKSSHFIHSVHQTVAYTFYAACLDSTLRLNRTGKQSIQSLNIPLECFTSVHAHWLKRHLKYWLVFEIKIYLGWTFTSMDYYDVSQHLKGNSVIIFIVIICLSFLTSDLPDLSYRNAPT